MFARSIRETARRPESVPRDDVEAVRVRGRPYAFVSTGKGAAVIRSLEIDNPSTGSVRDRIDYTESYLIVYLGTDVEGRLRIFTIPRYVHESSQPTVVEISMRPGGRNDVVWSLAGRGKSPAVTAPNLRGVLPSAVKDTLREAFRQALHRVREVPNCRSLFEEFALSGNQRLTTTLYVPPNESCADDSCHKGALAFTHVGSSTTHLCAGFGGLSLDQATIVLIHEALHFAGMEEAPFYGGARTSRAINELVFDRCGF